MGVNQMLGPRKARHNKMSHIGHAQVQVPWALLDKQFIHLLLFLHSWNTVIL